MEQKQPLTEFCQGLADLPLPQQWLKWTHQIDTLKKSNNPSLHPYLQRFNEYFPFNTQYWTKLAYIELKKGKPECIKIFQLALTKNPKSISLWKQYFTWLRDTIRESDPEFLVEDLERGLRIIGKHPQSKLIYDYWFESVGESNHQRKYQMTKRVLSLMVSLKDEAGRESMQWLKSLSHESLAEIAKGQNIVGQDRNILGNEDTESLKLLINKLENLLKQTQEKYRAQYDFQRKILSSEYKAYDGNMTVWREYITYMKRQNSEELPDIYQRALINNCDNVGLWKEYLEHMEFQCGNPNHILTTFRSIPIFFKNLDVDLVCYWIQLEETQNVYQARQLLVEIQQTKPTLQIFHQHLQLQIRSKNYTNGKAIYQSILNTFSNNLQIVSFTVIEYTQFIVKYFRDVELCKKILKSCFERYPFNQYLFLGYIEFYSKNVEIKGGNKEVFNEFMEIVKAGVLRGHKALGQNEYESLMSRATHLIRTYLPTVFLLKSAERIIVETELAMKNVEIEEIRKARLDRFQGIQTLSKRRKMNQAQQQDKLQSLY